jgi:hypothetical protein
LPGSGFTPIELDAGAEGPLADVRMLDLSRLVAGNMLSPQLADFGADVIKVEPPDGDPLRDWRDGGRQLHWKTYARNKRSIVLNLRHGAARDALLRLLGGTDVLIENYRPGTLEEMNLSSMSRTASLAAWQCIILFRACRRPPAPGADRHRDWASTPTPSWRRRGSSVTPSPGCDEKER